MDSTRANNFTRITPFAERQRRLRKKPEFSLATTPSDADRSPTAPFDYSDHVEAPTMPSLAPVKKENDDEIAEIMRSFKEVDISSTKPYTLRMLSKETAPLKQAHPSATPVKSVTFKTSDKGSDGTPAASPILHAGTSIAPLDVGSDIDKNHNFIVGYVYFETDEDAARAQAQFTKLGWSYSGPYVTAADLFKARNLVAQQYGSSVVETDQDPTRGVSVLMVSRYTEISKNLQASVEDAGSSEGEEAKIDNLKTHSLAHEDLLSFD